MGVDVELSEDFCRAFRDLVRAEKEGRRAKAERAMKRFERLAGECRIGVPEVARLGRMEKTGEKRG